MVQFHNWWGKYRLAAGRMSSLDVGSFSLRILRENEQWLLAWSNRGDPLAETCTVRNNIPVEPLEEGMQQVRFGAGDRDERIEIRPLTGDRPFVAKPEVPVCILPGEAVTLYITIPVSVGVVLHEAAKPQLEFPALRGRDTWFGRDNTEGQLCYASRTWAHMNRDSFRPWPHRAVTAVIISNRALTPLSLDRIKLPIPNFTLYQDDTGCLRTSGLLLKRNEGQELAHARLLEPTPAERWTQLAPPRMVLRNRFLEAFAEVF